MLFSGCPLRSSLRLRTLNEGWGYREAVRIALGEVSTVAQQVKPLPAILASHFGVPVQVPVAPLEICLPC